MAEGTNKAWREFLAELPPVALDAIASLVEAAAELKYIIDIQPTGKVFCPGQTEDARESASYREACQVLASLERPLQHGCFQILTEEAEMAKATEPILCPHCPFAKGLNLKATVTVVQVDWKAAIPELTQGPDPQVLRREIESTIKRVLDRYA